MRRAADPQNANGRKFAPSLISMCKKGAILGACLGAPVGHASQLCTEDAMIVFDGSGSMAEPAYRSSGTPRILAARTAVREVVPDIAAIRRLGLVVYGPGRSGGCDNIETRLPPTMRAGDRIVAEIEALAPAGNTPLTAAVEQAAIALDHLRRAGAIVLVTDGSETCFGQPCRLATRLASESHDLTIHVIGFQIRGEFYDQLSPQHEDYMRAIAVLRCLSDRTGGVFATAETTEELSEALTKTLGCPVVSRPWPAVPLLPQRQAPT